MASGDKGRGRGGRPKRGWRIGGWRVATIAGAAFLLLCFAAGFYLAQLYGEISELIEQRRAALSSAIYSAPTVIKSGDDTDSTGLLDRLDHLSYSQVAVADAPGEYSRGHEAMTIYARGFKVGFNDYAPSITKLRLDGNRVAAIADSFGVPRRSAMLEPEVVGRLLAGAPAERTDVALGDLKPYFMRGLIATEDRWFYYHPGVDPIRVLEAALVDLRSHRLSQGASTITQQLARTFLDRFDRSFGRKFRELAVAIVLEIRLSKNEILERYINDVPMGSYSGTPIEGMPQAARYLFNKDLRQVNPAEAATLIGMIQAPSLYDPRRHLEACRARRNTVLWVMMRDGVIDERTYLAAVASPIDVNKPPGLRRAPYFTDYVTNAVENVAGLHRNLKGLKVYTTL